MAKDLLNEANGKERAAKFLVMGARRDGGQMAPVDFYDDQGMADAAAGALARTGWCCAEVYTRVSEHRRK